MYCKVKLLKRLTMAVSMKTSEEKKKKVLLERGFVPENPIKRNFGLDLKFASGGSLKTYLSHSFRRGKNLALIYNHVISGPQPRFHSHLSNVLLVYCCAMKEGWCSKRWFELVGVFCVILLLLECPRYIQKASR